VVTDGRRLLLVGAAVAALLCPGCGARRGRQPPSQVGVASTGAASTGSSATGEPATPVEPAAPLDPAELVAGPPRPVDGRYLFTLYAPGAHSVTVAGTFNGWLPTANPMQHHGDLWYALIDLPYGRHTYRFLVDGTRWMVDPDNPRRGGDGMGGTVSILSVR
jgi:hypothetical protein